MEILNCNERVKNSVHSAKRSRREGKIPGILYGEKLRNIMFEISEMDLNKEISRIGEHGTLKVNINGTEHDTLIKEIQREPANHKIIHIDLEEINPEKIVQTEVPLIFIGSERVASNGGIVQKEKDIVKIQCKASVIPKSINVDVSRMDRGKTFRIRDIEAASEITFMEDLNTIIAAVTGGNTNDVTVNTEVDEIPKEI